MKTVSCKISPQNKEALETLTREKDTTVNAILQKIVNYLAKNGINDLVFLEPMDIKTHLKNHDCKCKLHYANQLGIDQGMANAVNHYVTKNHDENNCLVCIYKLEHFL